MVGVGGVGVCVFLCFYVGGGVGDLCVWRCVCCDCVSYLCNLFRFVVASTRSAMVKILGCAVECDVSFFGCTFVLLRASLFVLYTRTSTVDACEIYDSRTNLSNDFVASGAEMLVYYY